MNYHLAIAKTIPALMLAFAAFLLGGYASRFDGSPRAWIVMALSGGSVVFAIYLVVRDFWKLQQTK
jgi:hypothetical protein